jgi:hypothetical protein
MLLFIFAKHIPNLSLAIVIVDYSLHVVANIRMHCVRSFIVNA